MGVLGIAFSLLFVYYIIISKGQTAHQQPALKTWGRRIAGVGTGQMDLPKMGENSRANCSKTLPVVQRKGPGF